MDQNVSTAFGTIPEKKMRETELRLEVRIAEAKTGLTRWVVGAGILQTSLIIGVLLKVAKLI